jgi:hypothetical protein
MKDKSLIIRITQEEIDNITKAYKEHISKKDIEVITKSEFIRKIIREAIKDNK